EARALPEVRHDQEDEDATQGERADREALTALGGALGFLGGKEVDAKHLSPGRRVASPTVTASAGALPSTSVRSTPRSSCTRLNGFATSTAQPRRFVRWSDRPPIPAVPPDRTTPPSGSSVAAVQKK